MLPVNFLCQRGSSAAKFFASVSDCLVCAHFSFYDLDHMCLTDFSAFLVSVCGFHVLIRISKMESNCGQMFCVCVAGTVGVCVCPCICIVTEVLTFAPAAIDHL